MENLVVLDEQDQDNYADEKIIFGSWEFLGKDDISLAGRYEYTLSIDQNGWYSTR